MKKYYPLVFVVSVLLGVCVCPLKGYGYPSSVSVLEAKDILKLSDSALTSLYLDTLIEIDAIKIFHKTSGFNPKEYQEYKNLLRFRYELKSELKRRQLEIPSIGEEHD